MHKPTSKNPNLFKIENEFIENLKNIDAKPLYELTPEEARQFLIDLQAETYTHIDAEVEDIAIYTKNSHTIDLRVVRPKDTEEKLPVVLYVHGGGWVLGNKETHDMLIRRLAVCTNCVVIFPEYSLSPEAKYPIALNQIYEVYEYILENHEEFNINPEKLVIAGDSAGANMATVTALRVKSLQDSKILAQILLYPVTDFEMNTDSYSDFKDGPWLSKESMKWFAEAYLSDKDKRKEISISPLQATVNELENMPKTLIITAENDVLCEEGELYAQKLQEAGNEVFSVRINGTCHDFLMLNALSKSCVTQGAIDLICNYLYKIFTE